MFRLRRDLQSIDTTRSDWLLSQEPRPEERQQRLPERNEGGPEHVRKRARHQHIHLDSWLRGRADTVEPSADPRLTALGHPICSLDPCP